MGLNIIDWWYDNYYVFQHVYNHLGACHFIHLMDTFGTSHFVLYRELGCPLPEVIFYRVRNNYTRVPSACPMLGGLSSFGVSFIGSGFYCTEILASFPGLPSTLLTINFGGKKKE